MDKEQIIEAIEAYHQKNYYNLFPAGRINSWVYDAVLENIVQPLEKEIFILTEKNKLLRSRLKHVNPAPAKGKKVEVA